MKKLNEELLLSISNFIHKFQLKNGRSPSYREIMKNENISSLSTVSRYIDVLEQKELIKKSNLGKIEIPLNMDKNQTVIAPIVGQVHCGMPCLAEENYESLCALPKDIFGDGEKFILHACGDSMEGVGIHDGDFLVVERCQYADNGDIVVALLGDEATVKTLKKEKDCIILHPENPKYADIKTKNVQILGVVKHYIHEL